MAEIYHQVLLKIRADADPAAVEEAFIAVDAMRAIEGVTELVAGPDVSIEGLTQGHTHAVLVRLADAAARDRYMTHPLHLAVAPLMEPLLDGATVVDLEA